eukprot:TRINITY_DN42655_c0_g1_i1.p1 TRINITY_DN42655_c0_g1~~TRINITY_DN42655_c0_g1_i1.p1  ORF type:complete len:1205 (+),score=181.91 TRINITY_DN42655_c0_g1_i1:147-3617(+)
MWIVFTILGLVWTAIAPFTDIDFRSTFGRYQFGIASQGTGAAWCCFFVYSFQSLIFAARTMNRRVDPLLHAFEMLGTLICLLDVVARWCYACCDGMRSLLQYAFIGLLPIDCLNITATVALAVTAGPPGQEKKTWWSFSFMACFGIWRCLGFLQVNGRGGFSAWRRQVLLSALSGANGIVFCAALVMTLEILGPVRGDLEDDLKPGTENPWVVAEGMSWSISLFTMLGNSARNPHSLLGQIVATCGMAMAVYHLSAKIGPAFVDVLSGRNANKEAYPLARRKHKNPDGHTILTGSARPGTIWDFLVEFYHPNHFSTGQDFEREARDVVLLFDDPMKLKHVEKLLGLKEAVMFRSRVFMICGHVMNPVDRTKAGAHKAKRAVVLPDLVTSDVERDDQLNIMRTYALCSCSAEIVTTCMLHSSKHQGSMLSGSTPNSVFVSIDAIKMSLLGKASMFPGAMALILNLCVTVGDNADKYRYKERRFWISDYERSLDMELYEVPLSAAYHSVPFIDIFEDTLVRSKGKVYLIGLTDSRSLGSGRCSSGNRSRDILLNPGPDFLVNVAPGITAGVFIASDIQSIVQLPPGSELQMSLSRAPWKLALFEQGQQQSVEPNRRVKSKDSRMSSFPKTMMSETAAEANVTAAAAKAAQEKADKQAQKAKEEQFEAFTDQEYERIIMRMKKQFMEQGLPPDIVGNITNTQPFKRRFPRTNVPEIKEEESGSDGEGESQNKKILRGEIRMDYWSKLEIKMKELERIELTLGRVKQDLRGERKPARSLLEKGGHVILCLSGDTEVSSIQVGSRKLTGPEQGLACFMKSLRDKRLCLHEGSQPPVVVLGEVMPSDWHSVVAMDRVYYMQGSPVRVSDLERAGCKNAKCLVFCRSHNGTVGGTYKVADARVVLGAVMAHSLIPLNKLTPVVTDHSYIGSTRLLPDDRVLVEDGPVSKTAQVDEPSPMPKAVQALFGGSKALAKTAGLDGRPSPMMDSQTLHAGVVKDKYEDLEKFDIKYHPRFLSGQVFHPSAVASMVANSLHNPTLISLVDAMIECPMMLIEVPKAWHGSKYQDFVLWLLRERELLAFALYRSANGSQSAHTGDYLDVTLPSHYFVYTAPPGNHTVLVNTDRVVVTARDRKDWVPTKIGSERQQAKLAKAIKPAYEYEEH